MSKNKKKNNERRGETWVGYYPRKTKTKREKEISAEKKYKRRYEDE